METGGADEERNEDQKELTEPPSAHGLAQGKLGSRFSHGESGCLPWISRRALTIPAPSRQFCQQLLSAAGALPSSLFLSSSSISSSGEELMSKQLVGAAMAAALFWVAASAGQDVRPVPGFGSGVVTVKGTVDVGSMPDLSVKAAQAGEWKVSVADTPNVRVAATTHLDFLRQGQRYRIVWAPDQVEEVVVAQLGSWGWIRVESKERRRWINLNEALGVVELGS
jgi:hypothetical protein